MLKEDVKALCCYLTLSGCLILKILTLPFVILSEKIGKVQGDKK